MAPSGWPSAMAPPLTLTRLVRHVQVAQELQHDRGEGLVHLEQVDVVDGQAGLGQRLAGRRRRAGEHDRRLGADDAGGDDARPRGQAQVVAGPLAADQHQRGAVDDAGGVAGRVDVVDPLDPVVLLQRHRVEAAQLADGRRTTGLRPASDSRWCPARRNSSWSSTTRPLRSTTGTTDRANAPSAMRLGGARSATRRRSASTSSRVKPSRVAIRSALMPCGHEAGVVGGLRVHRPGAAVGAHRHPGHRLDAAGDDQVLPAGAHLLRGDVDRLQAGGAEAVQLEARPRCRARRPAPRSGRCRRPGRRRR